MPGPSRRRASPRRGPGLRGSCLFLLHVRAGFSDGARIEVGPYSDLDTDRWGFVESEELYKKTGNTAR